MQLLIDGTGDGDQIEARVRNAAARRMVRPIVLHGVGRSALAAVLVGVERSGVPCIVEEATGQAAELATGSDDTLNGTAEVGEWTIAILVGERNQHRWLHEESAVSSGSLPIVLNRSDGGHKLVYFGAS